MDGVVFLRWVPQTTDVGRGERRWRSGIDGIYFTPRCLLRLLVHKSQGIETKIPPPPKGVCLLCLLGGVWMDVTKLRIQRWKTPRKRHPGAFLRRNRAQTRITRSNCWHVLPTATDRGGQAKGQRNERAQGRGGNKKGTRREHRRPNESNESKP